MTNKQKLIAVGMTFAALAVVGHFAKKYIKVRREQIDIQLVEELIEE
jgi:hypothetical protein